MRPLKACTLQGPARFRMTPVVWVKVQFTQDTMATYDTDEEKSLETSFRDFMWREKIYGSFEVRAGTSGGGAYSGAFPAEEAERITAWLVEHGCIESDDP